jgi:hypothetical protein
MVKMLRIGKPTKSSQASIVIWMKVHRLSLKCEYTQVSGNALPLTCNDEGEDIVNSHGKSMSSLKDELDITNLVEYKGFSQWLPVRSTI